MVSTSECYFKKHYPQTINERNNPKKDSGPQTFYSHGTEVHIFKIKDKINDYQHAICGYNLHVKT